MRRVKVLLSAVAILSCDNVRSAVGASTNALAGDTNKDKGIAERPMAAKKDLKNFAKEESEKKDQAYRSSVRSPTPAVAAKSIGMLEAASDLEGTAKESVNEVDGSEDFEKW